MERMIKASSKLRAPIRFFEQLHMFEGPKFASESFFRETRGKEYAKVGLEGKGMVGEFDAVHPAREDDV